MSTFDAGAHEHWEALAAGHALHALEPDEQAAFEVHLTGCAQCRATVDELSFVAAQLGSLAESEDDTAPPTWSRIRAGVVGERSADGDVAGTDSGDAGARITPLRRRIPRRERLLAVAAAVLVVAGGAIAVSQFAGGGPPTPRPIAACSHDARCHVVRLHRTSGGQPASVLVTADRVTVVPTGMGAAPSGKVWVLWQLPRDGRPTMVGSFRAAAPGGTSARLPLPYADTVAFAISEERAGAVPAQPTVVVAAGSVGA